VDVFKVQHHASENNLNKEFCNAVTADHYVLCGNGAHENPDVDILDLIVETRLDGAGPERPFKLWFNSSAAIPENEKCRAHMRKVASRMASWAKSNDRVSYEFMRKGASSFDLAI
jgi:hypothetical protein